MYVANMCYQRKSVKVVCCVVILVTIILVMSEPVGPFTDEYQQSYIQGPKKVENITSKSCAAIQAARFETLAAFCGTRRGRLTQEEFLRWVKADSRVLVVDSLRLIISFVPKAMSTSLKVKLLEMVGERRRTFRTHGAVMTSLHKHGVRLLRTYTASEIEHRRATYYKMVFVRHPLKRILSAYVDKMLQGFTLYYLVSVYFAWRVRGLAGLLRDPRNLFRKLTFQEFIVNVLFYENRQSLDEHWKPVVDLVLPCEMGFDFIGRVETARRDLHCVFVDKLGQSSWYPNSNQNNSSGNYETYMSQIPKSLLKRIIDLYADDFRAFGYNIKP